MNQATPKVIASGWVVVTKDGLPIENSFTTATDEVFAWQKYMGRFLTTAGLFSAIDHMKRQGYRAIPVDLVEQKEGQNGKDT